MMNILLEAIRYPDKLNTLTHPQWEQLIRFARNAKMLGTLAFWVQERGYGLDIPKEANDLLTGQSIKQEHMRLSVLWELKELEDLFADTDFPIVILKGGAYIKANRDWSKGRQISDLDLLVPKQFLAEVEAKIQQHGWIASSDLSEYDDHYYREWSHELPPYINPKRGIELDLHHNLIAPTSRIKLDIDKIFSRAIKLPNSRFSVLCDEDMFIHSAVHLLFNDELRGGIRDIVDMKSIAEYAIKVSHSDNADAFWQTLERRSYELGVTRPVYYAANTLSHFFSQHQNAITPFKPHAPSSLINPLMQHCIRDTLAPDIKNEFKDGLAQLLLYIRSHWVRMPPFMLAYHLGYKAWLRYKNPLNIYQKAAKGRNSKEV